MSSQEYINMLKELLDNIDELDNKTPWQVVEPQWWLEMMSLRKEAQSSLNARLAQKSAKIAG